MWYPEEPITYCQRCEDEIPLDYIWRGRGLIISNGGGQVRTMVLYSVCPGCGTKLSVGLDGPWWYRLLYGWFWRSRYPNTRRPRLEPGLEERLRMAS